jgi:hypothetical protein
MVVARRRLRAFYMRRKPKAKKGSFALNRECWLRLAQGHGRFAWRRSRTCVQSNEHRHDELAMRRAGWGGREPGADGRLGLKRGWGGREYGADGNMGRKQGWGGREYTWGRKEYGAPGTPRHTILHLDPQATTFLSPPGGIYLIQFSRPQVRE